MAPLPTKPAYINLEGQPIYFVPGANVGKRKGERPRFLVMHHTAGTDSRDYLWQNTLGVSCHYLVGIYPDAGPQPRIYKYASETDDITYTQGFSTIGVLTDPNRVCISIEMEGPPIDPLVINHAATLAWSIISYWDDLGVDLVLLRHRDIDRQGKIDPTLDWLNFCQQVYFE